MAWGGCAVVGVVNTFCLGDQKVKLLELGEIVGHVLVPYSAQLRQ